MACGPFPAPLFDHHPTPGFVAIARAAVAPPRQCPLAPPLVLIFSPSCTEPVCSAGSPFVFVFASPFSDDAHITEALSKALKLSRLSSLLIFVTYPPWVSSAPGMTVPVFSSCHSPFLSLHFFRVFSSLLAFHFPLADCGGRPPDSTCCSRIGVTHLYSPSLWRQPLTSPARHALFLRYTPASNRTSLFYPSLLFPEIEPMGLSSPDVRLSPKIPSEVSILFRFFLLTFY